MTAGPTPAQTVGPFLSLGLDWPDGPLVVDAATPGAVRIGGRLLDGQGEPVGDGLVETWQADPDGRFPAPAESIDAIRGNSARETRQYPDGGAVADHRFRGFGRCLTTADGAWGVVTLKPGPLPAPDGATEAPHIDVSVFARGLLHRVVTRIYFADEEAANAEDPVLCSLPDDSARGTLVAVASAGGYHFDIHLQGRYETVFFAL